MFIKQFRIIIRGKCRAKERAFVITGRGSTFEIVDAALL